MSFTTEVMTDVATTEMSAPPEVPVTAALTETDFQEINGYEGVIAQKFGVNGQLEVFSTHAQVFLEKLEDVQSLKGYQKLVQDATDAGIANPDSYVAKKVIEHLGKRAAHPTSSPQPSFSRLSISEDKVIAELAAEDPIQAFSDNLANAIENKTWITDPEDEARYDDIADRAKQIEEQKQTHIYEDGAHKVVSPTENSTEIEFTDEEAEAVVTALAPDVESYTETLQADLTGDESQFALAARTQPDPKSLVERVYQPVENPAEAMKNLPEIIILGGVGHEEATWKERIEFYQKQGLKCRYIQCPDFAEGETFEKQADWLYKELIKTGKTPRSFEAHSLGGLILTQLMNKYPELVDHAIITCAPTRTNKELYPTPFVWALKGGLANPEQAFKLMNKIPALNFFTKLKNWQDAFRVYLGHIGEKGRSQWDGVVEDTSWTIPKYLQYGEKDTMVNIAGMGAAREATGAVYWENPNGGHNSIGNHEAARDIHLRLAAEADRRGVSARVN